MKQRRYYGATTRLQWGQQSWNYLVEEVREQRVQLVMGTCPVFTDLKNIS